MLDKAKRDYLTGFYLREPFMPYLRDLVVQAKLKKGSFSLLILDIDKFKNFNDKYGHQFGDEVLKYVSGSMRLSMFDTDSTIFRYGGDEFVIVLPDKRPKEAAQIAYRLKYNMNRRPFLFNNAFHKITLSIGIAGYPEDAEKLEDLIKKSDQAMYFSKKNGRNQATLSSSIPYLKARKLAVRMITIILVAGILAGLYTFAFKQPIQESIKQLQNIRFTKANIAPDRIRLKNGNVLTGQIVDRTAATVTFRFQTEEGGSGEITLNRSEIESIEQGS
ncbi:MAG: diguanylate cyclase [Candidatus Omnitrophica bacterium]|nr:diguanylate cyclase [Candidatus Omnitrophota bacterium]